MISRVIAAQPVSLEVSGPTQIKLAVDAARNCARSIGFAASEGEEIALVASELASNVVKHASGGTIRFIPLERGNQPGLRIECEDRGKGISDPERALIDGFSTAGSLGIGLGTVNRLMDDLELCNQPGDGLRVVCHRWVRPKAGGSASRMLEFGAATRPCPPFEENGDAFVIKSWENHALVGVLDGLGHGPLAQRAAQLGRQYLEQHFDQPLENLYRGAERACRSTRGLVMALARFDLPTRNLTVANVGNIEVRIVLGNVPFKVNIRRGVVGLNSPKPVLTHHQWAPGEILIMHSDGVSSHWQWEQFAGLGQRSASAIASELLRDLGKDEDDATVLVVKNSTRAGSA